MKKLMMILAGLLLAGTTVSYAGKACCPSKKAAAAKAKTAECSVDAKAGFMNAEMVKALKLTPEQQTKLAALQKECSEKTDCDVTQKAAKKKIKDMLTSEQLAACEKICKDAGGKCPLPKAEKVKS